jgi:hypothetical protein
MPRFSPLAEAKDQGTKLSSKLLAKKPVENNGPKDSFGTGEG